jgi:hypothetical protein
MRGWLPLSLFVWVAGSTVEFSAVEFPAVTVAENEDGGGGRGGGACVRWDLGAVAVPTELTFKARGQPGYVSFDADPPDVFSYWARIEAATAARGQRALHAALGLRGHAHDALLAVLARKRARVAEASVVHGSDRSGGGTGDGFLDGSSPAGLFLLLRGDSHLRIVLNMFLMTVSHDLNAIKRAVWSTEEGNSTGM